MENILTYISYATCWCKWYCVIARALLLLCYYFVGFIENVVNNYTITLKYLRIYVLNDCFVLFVITPSIMMTTTTTTKEVKSVVEAVAAAETTIAKADTCVRPIKPFYS